MRIRALFTWVIFLVYLLYSLNHIIFERIFYFNELLSFVGLICFIRFYIKGTKLIIPKFIIFRCVLLFQVLFLVHAAISFPDRTNNYYYLRHFSIFYSSFIFFLGFGLSKEFISIFTKIYKLLFTFLFINIPLKLGVYGLGRYTGPLFLSFLTKNIKNNGLLILVFIVVAYAVLQNEDTAIVFAFFLIYIHFFKKFKDFKIVVTLITAFIIFFFIYFNDNILLYKTGGYRLFGNISAVRESHAVFALDSNTTWRIMLWYRHIVEKFPENLFGVGIGNAIIPYKENMITAYSHNRVNDEHMAHLTGAHNSLVTVFTRFGFIGVWLILVPIYRVFKFYFNNDLFIKNNYYLPFFIAYFFILFVMLLNPGLFSPIYSGNYWMLLGIVGGIIYNYKNPV